MRYVSLFVCVLVVSGCNSAQRVAENTAAQDARIHEVAVQRANNIKLLAASEARLMCANSSDPRCYEAAYAAKIAAAREALYQREDQRQLEAARIVANSPLLRHGTVNCSYYGTWSSCAY
jgi:hypothetical protein